MVLRECAEKSAAFQKLKNAYTHREEAAKAAKAAGKKVVGTLGCDVPEELILAAGMQPYPIYAVPGGPMDMADKYLEYAFDKIASSFGPRWQNSSVMASVIEELNLMSVPLNLSFCISNALATVSLISFEDWVSSFFRPS